MTARRSAVGAGSPGAGVDGGNHEDNQAHDKSREHSTMSTKLRTRAARWVAVAVAGLVTVGLSAGLAAWTPSAVAGSTEPAAVRTPSAASGFAVSMSADTVAVGEKVTFTVTATSASDLYAYDLTVKYDPRVLAYVEDSATTPVSGSTYDLVGDGTVDVVHTKLGTSPSAEGSVKLATLTFTAVRAGATAVAAPQLVTVNSENGSTTVSDVAAHPLQVVGKGVLVGPRP